MIENIMKLEQASINKYLPIAVLYFFLNGLFLPLGLLYTTLLTPFFLIWLARYPIIRHVGWYFVFVTPFVIIHFIHGVSPFYYLTSFTLFFCVFVFCLTFYQFLQVCKSLGSIYRDLVVLSFIFTIVAIIAFFIPFFRPIFWNSGPISFGIE